MRRILAACIYTLAVLASAKPLQAEPTLTFEEPAISPQQVPERWGFDPITQMPEMKTLTNGTFNFINTDSKYIDFHFEFPDQGGDVVGRGGRFFRGVGSTRTTLDFFQDGGSGIEPDGLFTITITGFNLPAGTNIKATPTMVPEPSTLVMASLAGLVGLGYAWYRGKRATI
jgi:hypothetical protein